MEEDSPPPVLAGANARVDEIPPTKKIELLHGTEGRSPIEDYQNSHIPVKFGQFF